MPGDSMVRKSWVVTGVWAALGPVQSPANSRDATAVATSERRRFICFLLGFRLRVQPAAKSLLGWAWPDPARRSAGPKKGCGAGFPVPAPPSGRRYWELLTMMVFRLGWALAPV